MKLLATLTCFPLKVKLSRPWQMLVAEGTRLPGTCQQSNILAMDKKSMYILTIL